MAILIITLVSVTGPRVAADDRLWLKDAEVNKKPLKLVFDSGSGYNFLSPAALKRLGVKFIPAETNYFPSGVLAGNTEQCTLSLEGVECKTTFVVLDLPGYVGADFDGGIGWYSLSQNILKIDAESQRITFLTKISAKSARWCQLSLSTNSGTLDLRIPHVAGADGVLCIDTGLDGGVNLPKGKWLDWIKSHPQGARTLKTAFSPLDGFEVQTEAWTEKISFGPIVLTDVPIANEGPKKASLWSTNYEGTIGLAALRRLDFVVDGRNGIAYLSPKKTAPPPYTHNRLGAVFVPTYAHTNQAVARVLTGSPAYEAGVRDGDVLLQVDEIACTSWNATWLNRFQRPAGTKLKLTLERDGKPFKTTAILRDILRPGADKHE